MRKVVPQVIEARRNLSDQDELKPGPRTRFNGHVSANRVVDGVFLDLDRVKTIRNAVPGATLNDVVLCVVGGALREYLLDKNELPEKSLMQGRLSACAQPKKIKRGATRWD